MGGGKALSGLNRPLEKELGKATPAVGDSEALNRVHDRSRDEDRFLLGG